MGMLVDVETAVTSEQARTASAKTSPSFPSGEEWAAHEARHLPSHSWRKHCVAARARDEPYKRGREGETSTVAVVSLDDCSLAQRGGAGGRSAGAQPASPRCVWCGLGGWKGANKYIVEYVLRYADLGLRRYGAGD